MLLLRALKTIEELDETIQESMDSNDIVSEEEMEKLKLKYRFLLFKISMEQLQQKNERKITKNIFIYICVQKTCAIQHLQTYINTTQLPITITIYRR